MRENGLAYKIVPGHEANEMDDGLVIYQELQEQIHHLNPAAAIVYQLCGDGCSPAAMAQVLQSVFVLTTDPQQEVADCLESLLAAGLIAPC